MDVTYIYFLIISGCSIEALQPYNQSEKQSLLNNNVDNDYYSYDYELANNLSVHFNRDSAILPNPESFESKYMDTVDALPNIDLPDNSLADTDLHDHDFIDNIMYIYYGTHTKNGYTFGAEVIIIGSVLSCAAQFLTIICTLLRRESRNEVYKIYLNIVCCLCIANLIFMLGVYSTKHRDRCRFIAVLLHYMHLVTSVWIFVHSYLIFKRFSNEYVPKMRIIMLLAYGIPAFLIMLCYGVSPNSYESRKFCWMSVQRGMFMNFMLPVASLIIVTTLIALNGIRKINFELSKYELSSTDSIITTIDFDNKSKMIEKSVATYVDIQLGDENAAHTEKSDEEDSYLETLHASKKCLKMLAIVQTTYIVVWFVAVLALENAAYSSVMPTIYAVSSCILNWYIFARSKYLTPSLKDFYNMMKHSTNNENALHHSMEEANLSQCETDNVPLLINGADNFTELIELRSESISTISS